MMSSNPMFFKLSAISLLMTGCSSISGLDASDSFSCKAAPGVTCQSISGVHQNASVGNLPFQRSRNAGMNSAETNDDDQRSRENPPVYGGRSSDGKVSPRNMDAAYSGMPVRQPPLVLRIWMAPYEDEIGDLHDQSYFYTMVHSGKWMIEANRNVISSQYRPVFPLNGAGGIVYPAKTEDGKAEVNKGDYNNLVNQPDLK